jgi:hypothetical protein
MASENGRADDVGPRPADVRTHAVHRTIVAVDVERFADSRRTRQHQLVMRAGLYRAVRTAFGAVGLRCDDHYHEDRGDGLFMLLPAEAPMKLIAGSLLREFAAALREHNATAAPLARIRVRVALHAGQIQHDRYGATGTALNTTFRLLEAEAVKEALAASPGVVAVIASDRLYEDVIRHEPAGDPAGYRRVRVAVKETQAPAWVSRPDYPYPPRSDHSPRDRSTSAARTVPCARQPRSRRSIRSPRNRPG